MNLRAVMQCRFLGVDAWEIVMFGCLWLNWLHYIFTGSSQLYISLKWCWIAFFAHAIMGGLRWQNVLVYFNYFTWIAASHSPFLMFFSTVISCAACLLFPYPKIPRLKGGWAVGIEDFEFNAQIFGHLGQPVSHSCNVSLFYPSDHRHENDAKSRWFPDGDITAQGYANVFCLPVFFINYLTRVVANSVIFSPHLKINPRFRVIVFSHGIGGTRMSHSSLCHALASQGYIVAAVEHNDGSAAATKVNGLVNFFKRQEDKSYKRSQLSLRVEEVNMVVENLRLLSNRNGHWMKDRLDFTQMGIVGHNLGAATALAVCMRPGTKNPFKSCVVLTPSMKEDLRVIVAEAQSQNSGLDFKCLVLSAEVVDKNLNHILSALPKENVDCFDVAESWTSFDHTDFSIVSPLVLRHAGLSGPEFGPDFLLLQAQMSVNFFSRWLPTGINSNRPHVLSRRASKLKEDFLTLGVDPSAAECLKPAHNK